MFQGLLKRAEQSLDQVVAKFVNRATVAIPLIVAGGFATAALTAKLIETYGSVTAYSMMAALFAVIGLVTLAVVSNGNGVAETPAEEATAESETKDGEQEPGLDPTDLLTPEVRSFLASSVPMALPAIARGVGRNLPMILILALIGFVISRFAERPDNAATGSDATASQDIPESGDTPRETTDAPAAAVA